MKNIFLLLVTFAVAIIFQSCGENGENDPVSVKNPEARFISMQTFSFTTAVDPATLTENQTVYLSSSSTSTRPETLVISSADELTAFIQITGTVGSDDYYQNIFSNLETHTYLLIKGPSCPDYFEYSGYQYSPPAILAKMNHFILDGAACPAFFYDAYYVLRGTKS